MGQRAFNAQLVRLTAPAQTYRRTEIWSIICWCDWARCHRLADGPKHVQYLVRIIGRAGIGTLSRYDRARRQAFIDGPENVQYLVGKIGRAGIGVNRRTKNMPHT